MTNKQNGNLPCSYFDACGDFDEGVAAVVQEVVDAYLDDDIPWTVGYSGGKDSTATLQLVWLALQCIGTGNERLVAVGPNLWGLSEW